MNFDFENYFIFSFLKQFLISKIIFRTFYFSKFLFFEFLYFESLIFEIFTFFSKSLMNDLIVLPSNENFQIVFSNWTFSPFQGCVRLSRQFDRLTVLTKISNCIFNLDRLIVSRWSKTLRLSNCLTYTVLRKFSTKYLIVSSWIRRYFSISTFLKTG